MGILHLSGNKLQIPFLLWFTHTPNFVQISIRKSGRAGEDDVMIPDRWSTSRKKVRQESPIEKTTSGRHQQSADAAAPTCGEKQEDWRTAKAKQN